MKVPGPVAVQPCSRAAVQFRTVPQDEPLLQRDCEMSKL